MNKNIFDFFTPKSETYYLNINNTLRQALERFDFHKFTVVPVIDDEGKYVSSISDGDILRFIKNEYKFNFDEAELVKISSVPIYREYKPLSIDTPFEEIYKLSLDQNFIPLVDSSNHYIGIIKRKTIISYLFDDMVEKK
ncbi:MAG: CBS domain-containing protein [Gammaproteobacteria bacterium]|nr:CBS domain-containing protein [Gammaproteobacteria bacterium]